MKNLSNSLLMEAYREAVALKLTADFISIIKMELDRRNLTIAQ